MDLYFQIDPTNFSNSDFPLALEAQCSAAGLQGLAHDTARKFRIQLRLQIPDGCSEDTLHKSLKQKLVSSFSNAPLFQVNIQGLGTKIWILDAKLDNGALSTTSGLRTKIRSPIQQAFEECLSPPDYESFIASFRKQGNNNRDFLKKNLQLGNARVFMMNDLLPLPLNKAHAIILSSCLTVSIEGIGGKVEDRFFLF